MRKKLFPFITILTLALFLGACNSEDVMPEIGSETNPELTERTISFTASMPGEDDPATRVGAAEEADRGITLTWDENDKLDLLFVQGENKFHESTTVTNIENGGKNATFTVPLPDGITDGTPYNLYGVYGGGAVSTTNPALIGLPAIEGTTLNEENVGKKVMLRFAKEGLNLTDAVGAVNFEHVGFLFTAKIKVTAGSVNDITSVQLVGADAGNETWAYNASANHLDMEAATFTAEGTRGNTVNFQNSEKDATNNILTVRNWLPGAQTEFPTLKLRVNGTATAETKPARTLEVGRAYYLYAQYDGTELVFADKEFTVPQTIITIANFIDGAESGQTYTEDHYIEGEVILNPAKGNLHERNAVIADETAGVAFRANSGDDVLGTMPLGAKVKIHVQGAKWTVYNGLLQIELGVGNVEIVENPSSEPLTPKVVSMQDILDGNYQSELVQIDAVQFKNVPATYQGTQVIESIDSKELNVYTRDDATFAANSVMEGNGPIIGVAASFYTPQLLIRSLDDLAGMTNPRIVPPFLNTDVSTLSFVQAGGSETVNITSNVSWTATSDATWATISPASGTNDGTITVSVEANTAAEARSATITITPDVASGLSAIEYSVTQAGAAADFAETLFFSEYIEGSGTYNKGLEIYNGTGAPVDLSDYQVEIYVNGSNSSTAQVLSGILQHGEVAVLQRGDGANAIYTGEALTFLSTEVCNFNGNDALALRKISTNQHIDIIGHIGQQKNWSQDGNSTKDNTLVRNPDIKKGVTSSTVDFPELGTEWTSYPQDTKTYLGSHDTNY